MANNTLKKILHSKKVPYKNLDKELRPHIPNHCEKINVFIDIHSIYNSLYNPDLMSLFNKFTRDEKFALSSDLINAAGHYRHYFFSRLNKYTNIFLFYSSKKNKRALEIDENYKKEWYEKRLDYESKDYGNMNTMMKNNLKITSLLSTYIPHCYLIDGNNVENFMIPYLIIKNKKLEEQFSVIISNDSVYTQYLNIFDSVINFQVRGHNSFSIDSENVALSYYKREDKIPNFLKEEPLATTILYNFNSYIDAICGHNKFDISPIKGWGVVRVVKKLIKLLKDGKIEIKKYRRRKFLSILYKEGFFTDEEIKKVYSNLLLTDIVLINKDINNAKYKKIEDQLVDINSLISLRQSNNKYYSPEYQINLKFIMDGEV